jgi:type VI secretion system secreted protein VgrG
MNVENQAIEGALSVVSSESAKTPVVYYLEIGGERYEALRVVGEERLSSPGEIEVTFRIPPQHGLDPDAAAGERATLAISRDGRDVRRITRTVMELVREAVRKGVGGTNTVTARLAPRMATLRYRVDIRVFRDKTANQIAREVLTDLGCEVEERLHGSYVPRAYTVQMRESDIDFAQRLLEDDGIAYFVTDDDVIVFADALASYEPTIGVLPFTSGTSLNRTQDSFFEIGMAGEVTPGKISLRDFNAEHPSLNMDVAAEGPYQTGPEYYDYPGEYLLPDEGRVKARWRAEALSCRYQKLVGRAFAPDLRLAVQFVLSGAPMGVQDGGYLVRTVKHDWDREKGGFGVYVEAHRDDVVYRPPVVTPIPTLRNPLTGYATGPAGEDIYTDRWGRCKIHFPWDRLQPKDDRCSDWVPVLQDNTGHSVGIARIGWEMLVHFMEGDPDRPLVVGRVFNPEDPFPEILPINKTKTALRSLTSPRRAKNAAEQLERNELLFEDAIGKEEIRIQAQRDQNVVVANDKVERIDNIEATRVGGHEVIAIGEEHHEDVVLNSNGTIGGNQTWLTMGSRSFEVTSSQAEDVGKNHTLTIGGSHFRRIQTEDGQAATVIQERIGGLDLEASVKTNTKTGNKISAVTVGGAVIELARVNKSDGVGKVRVESVGGIAFIKAGKEIATKVGKTRRTMVGAAMMVDALKRVAINGGEKLSMKAASGVIDGAQILTVKVGETEITLKDGVLLLKAGKGITFKADAANRQAVGEAKQI